MNSPLLQSKHTWLLRLTLLAMLVTALLAVDHARPRAAESVAVITYVPETNVIRVVGPGSVVTVRDIANAVPDRLRQTEPLVWELTANLQVEGGVTLYLQGGAIGGEVNWLRLRSDAGGFVWLKAFDGQIKLESTRITSWDPAAGQVDTAIDDGSGRAFIVAKSRRFSAALDISRSELAYLGYQPGESSGVTWRVDTRLVPTISITGGIHNSYFHHNYTGALAVDVENLVWTGNEFTDNVRAGLEIKGGGLGVTVQGNTFSGNGDEGFVQSDTTAGVLVSENTAFGNNLSRPVKAPRATSATVRTPSGPVLSISYEPEDDVISVVGPGSVVTLSQIAEAVGPERLRQEEPLLWYLNANLMIEGGVTLQLHGAAANGDVNWLRLRSDPTGYTWLKTYDGKIDIDGATITSWDNYGGHVDQVLDDGRAHIVAKSRRFAAGLLVNRSELAYLGFKSGEASGVTWRVDRRLIPTMTIAGIVRDSRFHDNYMGALAIEADSMLWHGNEFSMNEKAGLELRGNGRDTTIEHNTLYANGGNGLLLTDGAGSVVIRDNSALYNKAAGIQLDERSDSNHVEFNETEYNQYGIELFGASRNSILSNTLDNNEIGLSISGWSDTAATLNRVEGNTAISNIYYGIRVFGNADRTVGANGLNDVRLNGVRALALESDLNVAPAAPLYTYIEETNTILVEGYGNTVTPGDIARAIDRPELLSSPAPGEWYLAANLLTEQGVVLSLKGVDHGGDTNWLKLRSDPGGFVTLTSYDGAITMLGTKVTSWDMASNSFDTNVDDGRAYVLTKARTGRLEKPVRMDIAFSELGYLGYKAGEAYGIAWRATEAAVSKGSIVTGEVTNSKFYGNYFGLYTYRTSNLVVRGSEFFDNIEYGFDPHDYSHGFLVENNIFRDNGNHGLIFSAYCEDNLIRNNLSFGNGGHGYVLDRGSDNNTITNNVAHSNNAGIVIQGSDRNEIVENDIYGNNMGVRIDSKEVRGASQNNTFARNQIRNNIERAGLSYPRQTQNNFEENLVMGNGADSISDRPGGETMMQDRVRTVYLALFVFIGFGTVMVGRYRASRRQLGLPLGIKGFADSLRDERTRTTVLATMAALVVTLSVAIGLRFWGIGHESFWHDELHTATMTQNSYSHLLFDQVGKHPPLFFLMMKAWNDQFGVTETTMRLPALILSMAAMVVGIAMLWRYFGAKTALIAGAIMTVSPYLVAYAQEARMYALFSVLFTGSTFVLMRYAESRSWKTLAFYWLLTGLGFYTHYHYILYFVAQAGGAAVFLLGPRRTWQTIVRSLPLAFVAGLLSVYRFRAVLADLRQQGQIIIEPLQPTPASVWQHLEPIISGIAFGDPDRGIALVAIVFFMGLFAIGTLSSLIRRDPKIAFLVVCAVLPLVLAFAISLRSPIIRPRYFVPLIPFWYFVIAIGIDQLTRLRLPRTPMTQRWGSNLVLAPVLATIVVLGVAISANAHTFHGKEMYRQASELIAQDFRQGDQVFVHASYSAADFRFYLAQMGIETNENDFHTIYSRHVPSCEPGKTLWVVIAKLHKEGRLMSAPFRDECELMERGDFKNITVNRFESREAVAAAPAAPAPQTAP